jgi:integration host factor subunit beta
VIKSKLVIGISERNPHIYQRDVEQIVDAILDEITRALAMGNRVELRGFGAFSVRDRLPRVARNPRTGAKVAVSAKRLAFFKCGKGLRDRLNGNEAKPPVAR